MDRKCFFFWMCVPQPQHLTKQLNETLCAILWPRVTIKHRSTTQNQQGAQSRWKQNHCRRIKNLQSFICNQRANLQQQCAFNLQIIETSGRHWGRVKVQTRLDNCWALFFFFQNLSFFQQNNYFQLSVLADKSSTTGDLTVNTNAIDNLSSFSGILS